MNLAYHYPETNILPLCQDIFHFPARFPLAKYCAEVNVRCLSSTVSITALFTIARIWKQSFPVGSDDKEPPCNAGDPGSIPTLGRYTGEGNGNPRQCSCLKNSMDRGARGLQSMDSQRIRHSWAINTCRTWKQSRCPLTDECIQKLWCIYTYIHKGGIWVSPNEVDEPKAYCTGWSKSEIER